MTYTLDLTESYLGLPVKTGQEKTLLEIFVDGEKKYELQVSDLLNESCDYYCWLRLPECTGRKIVLMGNLSAAYFVLVTQAAQAEYALLARPLLHFTALRGWLNDPNGLVYHNGTYHLYFQQNPVDTEWGNMSWGHAVSKDLLSFWQTDTVLLPDETGTMYSGSGLVNERGLLGLPEDALVFFYTAAGGMNPWSREASFHPKSVSFLPEGEGSSTVGEECTGDGEDAARPTGTSADGFMRQMDVRAAGFVQGTGTSADGFMRQTDTGEVDFAQKIGTGAAGFTQRIAASTDGGWSLRKLPREAVGVIGEESRDPQVFWHEESAAYVMTLWIRGEEMAILRSEDLQNWEMTDRFILPGAFECPNLFCLPVADDSWQTEKADDTQSVAHVGTDQARAANVTQGAANAERSRGAGTGKNTQWVLTAADGSYYLGDFDGYRFRSDGVRKKSYLTDLPYAAQVYNGIKDRTVMIAWLRTKNEGCLYTGAMSLPRELGLIRRNGTLMLQMHPVREYEASKRRILFGETGAGSISTCASDGGYTGSWACEMSDGCVSFEIREEAVTELVLRMGMFSRESKRSDLTGDVSEELAMTIETYSSRNRYSDLAAVSPENQALKVEFFGNTLTVKKNAILFQAGKSVQAENVACKGNVHLAENTARAEAAACPEKAARETSGGMVYRTKLPESFEELHLLIDRQIIEIYGNHDTQTAYYETGSNELTGTIRVTGCAGLPEVYQWKRP
ncbi:MAG: glycoside hydrolase family 32 protein [Lachnospiraceae bacterium]|nr:glycoside hydrolase family 32 protein [Lachnospiraceae bacterium]